MVLLCDGKCHCKKWKEHFLATNCSISPFKEAIFLKTNLNSKHLNSYEVTIYIFITFSKALENILNVYINLCFLFRVLSGTNLVSYCGTINKLVYALHYVFWYFEAANGISTELCLFHQLQPGSQSVSMEMKQNGSLMLMWVSMLPHKIELVFLSNKA